MLFGSLVLWLQNLKLINDGRKKWLDEDRPISKETVVFSKGGSIACLNRSNLTQKSGFIFQTSEILL
ncbi:MAG: hypothetical protein P0116_06685 [Candidatus Nitrosocosmicus sp.]|nr:hypothetical protein [Candidatus Nitrosocosmicus sp.]